MSCPDRLGLWWGTLEGADLETLIAAAGEGGFTDISLTPAMYFEARARGRSDDELRSRLFDYGVRVAIVDPLIAGLPGIPDKSTVGSRWRSTFAHDESDCFRVAEALGADAINVAHFLGAPTSLDELAESIGAIAGRAETHGVGVLVEFMPEGSIRNLRDAVAICSQVGRSNCKVMVDTWHLWRGGDDQQELAHLTAGIVGALQISDALVAVRASWKTPPERDRLMPGSGDMPLREMVDAIIMSGSDPLVGVEIFSSSWGNLSPHEVAQQARDSCQLIFE